MSILGAFLSSVLSTTTAGAPLPAQLPVRPVKVIAIRRNYDVDETTINFPDPYPWDNPVQIPTTSGIHVEHPLPLSSEKAILEIRRLTGMTWKQIASIFGVTQRSIHHWANGETMSAANEERLYRVLAIVRVIDRGSAKENRALLLGPLDNGLVPFDLLAEEKYEAVLDYLGSGPANVRPKRRTLSAEAQASRAPQSPDELVDAMHESIHVEDGMVRTTRAVRIKK